MNWIDNEYQEELRKEQLQFEQEIDQLREDSLSIPGWMWPDDEPVYHDRRHIKTLIQHKQEINDLL